MFSAWKEGREVEDAKSQLSEVALYPFDCPLECVSLFQGSFAEALGEFEEVELVSNLRRQESDLDKAGFEPPIEVVQSIGAALPPPPEPGTPVIMQRKQPIGMKLTFPASKAKK